MNSKVEEADYERRFSGMARLYGPSGLERLRAARVAVVGLGGVGSWAVEALARSGVGRLTLVDLDEVCISNVNRQIPAVEGAYGRFKAEVLAERVKAIHPQCDVRAWIDFYTETRADSFFEEPLDAVIDAIDSVSPKTSLIARCRRHNIPVVVSGAAGGRKDPTRIRIVDLAQVSHDRLLAEARRRLRKFHGFPSGGATMDVPCVWSTEAAADPPRDSESGCQTPAIRQGGSRRLNCEDGYGSAGFVTGAFGLAAAAWVASRLAG